jgi:hypothetical protein
MGQGRISWTGFAAAARARGSAFAMAVVAGFGSACPSAKPIQALQETAGPQATPEDSGWVSLFGGTAFGEGFYVYKSGYVAIGAQTTFKIENGMIHAGGPYAILVTQKEYGFYRIRVDYRFGEPVGQSANAGMMILVDNAAAKTLTGVLRPRSIEVNCRRDNNYPWSLWSSSGLGPIMESTVKKGTAQFQARAEGGVEYSVDPSGNRTLESSYANPELPGGQWNHGEGLVAGDSGVFYLNGRLRTASWNWTVKQADKNVRIARGGVGVQSEGSDIWYRNWEIQELDSATRLPIHARRGCTQPGHSNYDPRAVIEDGSCGAVSLRAGSPGKAYALTRSHGAPRDLAGRARPGVPDTRMFRVQGGE